MVNQPDPFYDIYLANRKPDHVTVQTQEGDAILCWNDDKGVLHLAKTIEERKSDDQD